MRPNRRWIAPAALTALAVGTTTAALDHASSGPPRTATAANAASTTSSTSTTITNSTAGAASRAAAATAGNTEIAVATLGADLKVTLRAHKAGRYDAVVDVAAFRYSKGAWRPAWHERVPGPWFYYPLTGKGGVCSLGVSDRPGAAPTVDVSLLVSPSVGCSPVRHFTIR